MLNLNQVFNELALDTDVAQLVRCSVVSAIEFYNVYCTMHNVAGSTNVHGESQKGLDILADDIFIKQFLDSGLCSLICSEEQPEAIESTGQLAVCFDPLDGSSVIEANFATGSVLGVYRADDVIGLSPRQMQVAFYFVYGPNLTLTIASKDKVFAGKLTDTGWELDVVEPLQKDAVLALGNFQLLNDADIYKKVQKMLDFNLSLRYSGALVSDVHMLIVKSGGIFVRPSCAKKPPKLRLLYECGPLAFIVEALGGTSFADGKSILDTEITNLHQTVDFLLGNDSLVREWLEA